MDDVEPKHSPVSIHRNLKKKIEEYLHSDGALYSSVKSFVEQGARDLLEKHGYLKKEDSEGRGAK